MRITDLSNLFIGYNEAEDFRVLICAVDAEEAQIVANEYLKDTDMSGEFIITEFTDIDTRFDCDFVLSASDNALKPGISISRGREKEYADACNKNSDAYGTACVAFAERWARLLEEEIKHSNDTPLKVIFNTADVLSNKADISGITGSMYMCALKLLTSYWKYGVDLKIWHHIQYDRGTDKNPEA